MEWWSTGVLIMKSGKAISYSFNTITPVLRYSNWGEAPKFIV
jgi:hypothetical protein